MSVHPPKGPSTGCEYIKPFPAPKQTGEERTYHWNPSSRKCSNSFHQQLNPSSPSAPPLAEPNERETIPTFRLENFQLTLPLPSPSPIPGASRDQIKSYFRSMELSSGGGLATGPSNEQQITEAPGLY
ncbi:hypothetical protein AVEN_211680-1 [Araneus ventricosus]|uniref:Uncharacterized protein n=1 Tax=Araneus ventricosus TaxID=182803 RepID=A0A4Y2QBQ6_ARAVE|nr:hypothetical protein AVEN_211680-1 [Araneus ventricosus]